MRKKILMTVLSTILLGGVGFSLKSFATTTTTTTSCQHTTQNNPPFGRWYCNCHAHCGLPEAQCIELDLDPCPIDAKCYGGSSDQQSASCQRNASNQCICVCQAVTLVTNGICGDCATPAIGNDPCTCTDPAYPAGAIGRCTIAAYDANCQPIYKCQTAQRPTTETTDIDIERITVFLNPFPNMIAVMFGNTINAEMSRIPTKRMDVITVMLTNTTKT